MPYLMLIGHIVKTIWPFLSLGGIATLLWAADLRDIVYFIAGIVHVLAAWFGLRAVKRNWKKTREGIVSLRGSENANNKPQVQSKYSHMTTETVRNLRDLLTQELRKRRNKDG